MKKFLHDFLQAASWSKNNFSDLPWRKNRSFYSTLISEVMLQQTTVGTVKNRFLLFMEKYPNMHHLALAKDADLLMYWQGLGYYNRALRLRKAAEKLQKKNCNQLTLEELLEVDGIGDYTANALLAIGLNKRAIAIDVNMERVLFRYWGLSLEHTDMKKSKEVLRIFLSQKVLGQIKNYREFHEVVMDIGRVFCQARKMSCMQCPLKKSCRTNVDKQDYFLKLKADSVKKSKFKEVAIYRFVVKKANKILLVKRKEDQWLAGQWEVPSIVRCGEIHPKQYEKTHNEFKENFLIKSTITNHKFENQVILLQNIPSEVNLKAYEFKWFNFNDMQQLPLTSITQKILKKLEKS